MEFFENGRPVAKEVLMRNAMNEVLRDWYVGDCEAGVVRWNKIFERHGMSDRLRLPDRKFNRGIGMYSSFRFDPDGRPLTEEEWQRRKSEWLPTGKDSEYLLSIMLVAKFRLVGDDPGSLLDLDRELGSRISTGQH